jgi:hypothetical protein
MGVLPLMTNLDIFVHSEKGTKAAWKGFSSQTLYIANRLMLLNDQSEFFPEKVEDLLVIKDDIPVEAVQVKNIASDLTLSHFSPRKQDSFFRRALSLRQENEDLKAVIIAFGPLGNELDDLNQGEKEATTSVSEKLLKYDYSEDEVNWLLGNLVIQVVNQNSLEEQIYAELTQLTETMAAPKLAFDVLTNYVSVLSQKGEKTSKSDWNQRLHNIAIDFAAMSGFHQEYGRSLRPLFEYKTNLPLEKLSEEYRIGVNAHPDHIRNNLDVRREIWGNKIESYFDENQIVIIRGASGQGKSSLAYRYLIDTFPESNVICVEQIETSTQAANIVAAANNLSIARENNFILYIDVKPYQTGWLWILQQLQKTGQKIKLLITIREEDYRRAIVDKSSTSFEEIKLSFDRLEAESIYQKYSSTKFRNFDEAWHAFGETGPLMEFIYLLNEVETLEQKLSAQINRIRLNEAEAQSWLQFLRLSTYAGRLNLNLNLRKAVQITKCKNYEKMIRLFEKEYLLRETEDKTYIEPLHAIRAEIIYSVLKDPVMCTEEELLIGAIECVDDHSQMLMVNHCHDNNCSPELIERISAINFDKWENYASVIKGILWIEVYKFFQKNREIVLLGDSHFNNAFGFLALTDITGLLGEFDLEPILDIMKTVNPQGVPVFRDIFAKIPQKHLMYGWLDIFFKNYEKNLPGYIPYNSTEVSSLGYVLFWLSIRSTLIDPFLDDMELAQVLEAVDIDASLDLLEGIYHQEWTDLYHSATPALSNKVCSRWRIVHLEKDDSDTVSAHFIADIFDKNEKNKLFSAHSQNMTVVKALRKLYPEKLRYATKILGADFMEGIPVPDTKKNIDANYLKNEWITQLNSWFHNLNTYEHRASTWNEYVESVIHIRTAIEDSAQTVVKGLNFLYKKNGNLKKLTADEVTHLLTETAQNISSDRSLLPKSSTDRFGFVGDSVKEDMLYDFRSEEQGDTDKKNVHMEGSIQAILTKKFREAFKKYCSSFLTFLNQKDDLIALRVKRMPNAQNSHLALINLLETISQLKLVQGEFKRLFSELIDAEELADLENRETSNMELLLEIWKFLEETNLQKLDSVAFTRKKKVAQRKQKIERFFTQKLLGISGVSSASDPILQPDGDINIYITVDVQYTELFFEVLFKEFKNTFPDAATYTVDNFYIQSFISNIIVIPTFNNLPMVGSIKAEIRNLIIFDEEKFMRYRTPYEYDEYMKNNFTSVLPNDALFTRWILLLALTNTANLLLSHSDKTNQAIISLPESTIVRDVYSEWVYDGVSSLSEILEQFSLGFQKLSDALQADARAKQHLNSISKILGTLQSKKELLITGAEKKIASDFSQELTDCLEDLYPHVIQM